MYKFDKLNYDQILNILIKQQGEYAIIIPVISDEEANKKLPKIGDIIDVGIKAKIISKEVNPRKLYRPDKNIQLSVVLRIKLIARINIEEL